jgi:ATP-dependent Clp protease ATP-binding subunit ClpB
LGAHLIQDQMQLLNDSNRQEIMSRLRVELFEMLRKKMRPEFLNRIDEIIVFAPLTRDEIAAIVDIQFQRIAEMAKKQNITLTLSNEAKDWLGQLGYDPSFGARPLKRVMQKYIVNALSEKILKGEITEGDSVELVLNDRQLEFRKR